MKEYAKIFYNSSEWKDIRKLGISRSNGIYERCMAAAVVESLKHRRHYIITDGYVIGTVKLIYEGMDGLDVHKTPEWGRWNLHTTNGPIFTKGTYRVIEKIKVGTGYMYKLQRGAG